MIFARMSEINALRCRRWHGEDWLSAEDPWTLADWSNAMAGEAGEAANVVKKIRRYETGLGAGPACFPESAYERRQAVLEVENLFGALADELADVVLYADLLAQKAGIDLGAAVVSKFNRKSAEQGFPERLED